MGILRSGIFGPITKKTGPGIGRMHRGINVVTALYRINLRPSTAKQQIERNKFGILNTFLSNIETLVKPGFKKYAKRVTEVNAAFSYNYAHAFLSEGDQFSLNFPKIKYSRGHIFPAENAKVIAGPEYITYNWDSQVQHASCQFSDRASFLIYNPEKQRGVGLVGVAERSTMKHTMEIPVDFCGDTVHCYMSFSNVNGKHTGDSFYLGELLCQ